MMVLKSRYDYLLDTSTKPRELAGISSSQQVRALPSEAETRFNAGQSTVIRGLKQGMVQVTVLL